MEQFEKFGHHLDVEKAGSEWSPEQQDKILFESHTCSVGDLLSDNHFDVFVRYGYAESFLGFSDSTPHDFWARLYDKMQEKRVGFTNRHAFDVLITSFQQLGFDTKHPISVDQNYELLDGSHRLACAALFDAQPRVVVHTTQSHSYDKSWFNDKYTAEEIKKIEEVRERLYARYKELGKNYHVGVVWGTALEYWEEIIGMFDKHGIKRAFLKEFGPNIDDFIQKTYAGDGMPAERIASKAQKLSSYSTKAGILVLDENQNIADLKKNVRSLISPKMRDYFFDSIIHIIDDPVEADKIINSFKK